MIPKAEYPCSSSCLACKFSLCPAINPAQSENRADYAVLDELRKLEVSIGTVRARLPIVRSQESSDDITFICEGWAASVIVLANGSRQIVSFRLPGDFIHAADLFEPASSHIVEAITKVTYRRYRRDVFAGFLAKTNRQWDIFRQILLPEIIHLEQFAADLGRRNAHERISRLILHIMRRMEERRLVHDQTIDFPLRHHHIADATGLTPVHVSKVISEFRSKNIIAISDRRLTVCDPAALRRMAALSEPRRIHDAPVLGQSSAPTAASYPRPPIRAA